MYKVTSYSYDAEGGIHIADKWQLISIKIIINLEHCSVAVKGFIHRSVFANEQGQVFSIWPHVPKVLLNTSHVWLIRNQILIECPNAASPIQEGDLGKDQGGFTNV